MRYKNKSGRLWLLLAAITIMAAGFSMVTYAEEAIRTVGHSHFFGGSGSR